MSHATIEELLAERDWLADLVRRLVSDPGTADDIVQETCLTALRRPPGHRRGIRGWLATVARNLATDGHRRRAREDRRDRQAPADRSAPDTADVVARVEAEREIARLVLELPEPYRTTLLLRYWRGLGAAAIGRETGTPAGTVRSRLSRGHRMLRERLDRRHDGDRRAWVLGLLPLLRPKPAGGPAAMSIVTKVAAVLLLVTAAGVGMSLLLADRDARPPPEVAPSRGAEPPETEAQVAREEEPEPPEEPERPENDGRDGGKAAAATGAKPDPLDDQVTFSFADASLPQALGFLGKMKGLRFEFDQEVRESIVTLSCQAIAIRDGIDLLTRLAGCRWERRADGVIVVRRDPSIAVSKPPAKPVSQVEPEPPAACPPEPSHPAEPPPIELAEDGKAEPVPFQVLASAIEVVIDREGNRYVRLRPDGRFGLMTTEYAFLLRLADLAATFDSREAPPVLLRFDRRAPHKRTRWTYQHLRSLGRPTGDVWLVKKGAADAPAGVRGSPLGMYPPGRDGKPRLRERFPFVSRGGHRNLRARGGGRFTEGGVDLGLQWLAGEQDSDGAWLSAGDPIATTALVLVAFLGAGETPEHGRYRENLRKGFAWLEALQDETGRIGEDGHAVATIALAEAFALSLGDA